MIRIDQKNREKEFRKKSKPTIDEFVFEYALRRVFMQTDWRRFHCGKIKIRFYLKYANVIFIGKRVEIGVRSRRHNFPLVFVFFGQRLQVVIAAWSEKTG